MSERFVRLKAPEGVVGVEYGGEVFAVNKLRYVLVPVMAEAYLTQFLGFTFPDEPKIIRSVVGQQPILTLKRK